MSFDSLCIRFLFEIKTISFYINDNKSDMTLIKMIKIDVVDYFMYNDIM